MTDVLYSKDGRNVDRWVVSGPVLAGEGMVILTGAYGPMPLSQVHGLPPGHPLNAGPPSQSRYTYILPLPEPGGWIRTDALIHGLPGAGA